MTKIWVNTGMTNISIDAPSDLAKAAEICEGKAVLLGNVNKTLTTQKVREGVANAKNAGISTVGLFMIGLPGETPELTRETIEFAVDLDLDFANPLRFPPRRFPGIAVLRPPAPLHRDNIRRTLRTFCETAKRQPIQGKLWIVELDRVREYLDQM